MQGRRRQVGIVLFGLAVALGVIVTRLLIDSRQACRQGEAAQQRGDMTGAIRHYLDAGRLYVPGSPFVGQALDRLDTIGVALVNKGDYPLARSAFESERSALLGARSFYTPYADRLPGIERRIARLLAAEEGGGGTASASFEERAAWHAERLMQRPGPKTSMVLLALLGLGIWISCAVMFLRKGLSASLALERGPALLAGAGFLLGLALFLVGLRLA
jgi:hypothetical protein